MAPGLPFLLNLLDESCCRPTVIDNGELVVIVPPPRCEGGVPAA